MKEDWRWCVKTRNHVHYDSHEGGGVVYTDIMISKRVMRRDQDSLRNPRSVRQATAPAQPVERMQLQVIPAPSCKPFLRTPALTPIAILVSVFGTHLPSMTAAVSPYCQPCTYILTTLLTLLHASSNLHHSRISTHDSCES